MNFRLFITVSWIGLGLFWNVEGFGQEPQIYETGKLEEFEVLINSRFGYTMDIYDNQLVIGDEQNNKVLIFEKNGVFWDKKQELIPWDNKSNNFGNSVAISKNYLVVGANLDSDNGYENGAVYLFKKESGDWSPTDLKLIGDTVNTMNGVRFGSSVDISDDFLIVSAPNGIGCEDETCGNKIYIFQLIENNWIKKQEFTKSGSIYSFGQIVKINNEFILATANETIENEADNNIVYFYNMKDSIWVESGEVTKSIEEFAFFGSSLSLDENRFVTSSFSHSVPSGNAHLFEWDGFRWIETILPSESSCLSGVNSISIFDDHIAVSCGNEYLYKKQGNLWSNISQTINFTSNNRSLIYKDELFGLRQQGNLSIYNGFNNTELNLHQSLPSSGSLLKDYFGRSTSISNNYLAIGAASYNNTRGAVYTYKRKSGNTWEQMSQITKENGQQLDQFGRAVAISGDYLAVSSMGYKDGEYAGLVDIYLRSGDNWTHTATIDPLDYGGIDWDYFGFSLVMENDYLVIGAPTPLVHPDTEHDDHHFGDKQGQSPGAAYVFKRVGAAWHLIQKFQEPTGEIGDNFGYSIAISGNKIVVGAPRKNKVSGVAFVYEIEALADTTNIKYRQAIYAPDSTAGDKFALSVGIKDDHIIVGAPQDENPATTRGKAYIFQEENNVWNYKQMLEPSNGIKNDRFGWSVAITREVAVVGANLSNLNGSNSGAAYVFRGTGTNWIEKEILTASDGMGEEQFGIDVSLGGDINQGTDIIIGASHAKATEGAAYTYYMDCICASNGNPDESIGDIMLNPDRYWNPDSNEYVTQFGILSGSTFIFTEPCFDIKNAFSLSDVIVTEDCSYDLTMEIKNYQEPDYTSTNFEDYYLDRNASVVWTATDLCGNTLSVEFFIEIQSSRCLKLGCTNFSDYETLVGATTRECQNASSKIKFKRKKKKRIAPVDGLVASARSFNSNTPICTFEGEIICENNNEVLHEVAVQIMTCVNENDSIFDLCATTTEEGNCGEIFVDSGGKTGNYTSDENATYVFCPDDPNTQTIAITFSSFSIEKNPFGSGCHDFLEVFNGNDNTATLIGQFCGETLTEAPGEGTIRASNATGCLTFHFDSDGDSEQAGWEATVTCINIGDANSCTADELTINTMSNDTATYHARQNIYSTSTIENNQAITFKAGQSISLNTGFHAKATATFLATIESCPNDLVSEFINTSIAKNNLTKLTAFPNPFTNETTISYALSKEEVVTLQLVDIMGQQVALLEDKVSKEKGAYTISYTSSQLKAGTYFVVLSDTVHYETIKLLLIR